MVRNDAWATQAYLDALRPAAGWRVTAAFLATYSAELPAVVAALLALAGRDDERGSGSRVDLAEAVEHLRGKAAILFQGGHLTAARQRLPISAILDQFLVGVPFDASLRNWHPKVALVRMEDAAGDAAWRLWLGSRNLTTSDNLEFGLLLEGSGGTKGQGQPVEGVAELARELAVRAALTGAPANLIEREVQGLRWLTPTGVRVPEVRLLTGDGTDRLPAAPRGVEEVTVVSPFLHPRTVGAIGAWGGAGCRRRILSSVSELARVAAAHGKPLQGYAQLLAMPEVPRGVPDAEREVGTEVEAGAERHEPGLHAKLLVARRGERLTMWVGSANATERAWRGRNAEVIARMESPAALGGGLEALLGSARPVTVQELGAVGVTPRDAVEDRLEAARAQVVTSWSGRLVHAQGTFDVVCGTPPHPADESVQLALGRVVGPIREWPRDTATFSLGTVPAAEQSGLVTLGLRLGEREVTWLQGCPVDPPLGEARDRAALAGYLGAEAFLAWLRALLAGEPLAPAAAEAWDALRSPGTGAPAADGDAAHQLTVEGIMSSWARDPDAFRRADARLRDFLKEVIRHAAPEDAVSVARLRVVGETWAMLRSELLGTA